jgi:opacity protein-like surface antigen
MRRAASFTLLAVLCTACASGHGRRGGYIGFIRPDQRPPGVGESVAGDSLWGPSGESVRGDGIAESRRADLEQLVRRFAPTLVLPKADFAKVAGQKYRLFPTNIQLLTDTLRLDLIRAAPYMFQDSMNIALRTLDADSLLALTNTALRYESDPSLMVAWYFDWPGTTVSEWWQTYGRLRTGPDSAAWAEPTVYAHPFLDGIGRVVIQYWYFYPFNDFIGNHEGDWEHVNVVLTPDRSDVAEVHYYFHRRSIALPQGKYRPEIMDGTHPVVYVGGRMYNILDFPIRILRGERNEGSHGTYPFPGEWESAAALGSPEAVHKADKDSMRVVPHHRFRVVLTPEPSRIDYLNRPEVLREWISFVVPVRWGFPSAPSLGSTISADVGNHAPFGPTYNSAWNRTAPGMDYRLYRVRRVPFLRSIVEDLLQPWYYLYIFRTPRYVDDIRSGQDRRELERLGLVPRGGWGERGIGSPNLGLHIGYPQGGFSDVFNTSTGFLLWRNLWVKLRLGAIEILGGYQRFARTDAPGGALFVYPFTASVVIRAPDALLRPYASMGGGAYGWESRVRVSEGGPQLVQPGWDLGWTASAGVEYYLRTGVALDVGLRYHSTAGPGDIAGIDDGRLNFLTLWIGHFLRF